MLKSELLVHWNMIQEDLEHSLTTSSAIMGTLLYVQIMGYRKGEGNLHVEALQCFDALYYVSCKY